MVWRPGDGTHAAYDPLARTFSGADGPRVNPLYALAQLRKAMANHAPERVQQWGRVLSGTSDIGRANIDFVRRFFSDERLPIVAEDVGGTVARRLRYWPMSGRVQVLHIPMTKASHVLEEESVAARRIAPAEAGSVELF